MPGASVQLKIPDHVAELIRSMHPRLKQKIRAALKTILDNPGEGKALRSELKGLFTFRVARFRIVYRPGKKKVIEIVSIGPRKTIYEETYRLLKKEEAKDKSSK